MGRAGRCGCCAQAASGRTAGQQGGGESEAEVGHVEAPIRRRCAKHSLTVIQARRKRSVRPPRQQ